MKRCILCLAVLLLAACGASGPLYLPGTQPHKSALKKEHHKTDGTPATAEDAPPAAPEAQPAPGAPESTPNPSPATPQP
ncbi:MAG: lipoprotein [Nevskiales bacterium]